MQKYTKDKLQEHRKRYKHALNENREETKKCTLKENIKKKFMEHEKLVVE